MKNISHIGQVVLEKKLLGMVFTIYKGMVAILNSNHDFFSWILYNYHINAK